MIKTKLVTFHCPRCNGISILLEDDGYVCVDCNYRVNVPDELEMYMIESRVKANAVENFINMDKKYLLDYKIPDFEDIIDGLKDILLDNVGNGEYAKIIGNTVDLINDMKEKIKDQKRIIDLYSKADDFLNAHDWDWTKYEEWKPVPYSMKYRIGG